MANISRDTFQINKLKHYVNVRLQQGVPIVDADWNEMDDIRKFELEAFLKWFVGNGVPDKNDGFRISFSEEDIKEFNRVSRSLYDPDNNFIIIGGDGTLEGAGRCLVDGWDVINPSHTTYKSQYLYENPNKAAEWGVDPLPKLITPTEGNRTDLVYLDVWEREVEGSDDGDLINKYIDIPTCTRRKREWVVRVAEENEYIRQPVKLPEPKVDQKGNRHVYLKLAYLIRSSDENVIAYISGSDIKDLRVTGLRIMSQHDIEQITTDAYGPGYTLDQDGQPNLTVSLRQAINALLRGELPSTEERPLTNNGLSYSIPLSLSDGTENIWVFYTSSCKMPDGSINYDIYDIWCDYSYTNRPWKKPERLNTTSDTFNYLASVMLDSKTGNIWVFWYSKTEGNREDRQDWSFKINYNYYSNLSGWQKKENSLPDIKFGYTEIAHNPDVFTSLADRDGNIWIFWINNQATQMSGEPNTICFITHNGNNWGTPESIKNSANASGNPIIQINTVGDIFLFWLAPDCKAINYSCYRKSSKKWEDQRSINPDQLADTDTMEPLIYALLDKEENAWLFWISYSSSSRERRIWFRCYSLKENKLLTDSKLVTSDVIYISQFFRCFRPIIDSNENIWIFWISNSFNIWCNRYNKDGMILSSQKLTQLDDMGGNFTEISAVHQGIGKNVWVSWARLGYSQTSTSYITLETFYNKIFYEI